MNERLGLKEKIAFITSGLALLLSIVAFFNSEMKGRLEVQRTIRSQLTNVLTQIISLNLENAKASRDAAKDPLLYYQVSSILNQQNGFLLQQAIYLSEQIPSLVTTVELNTIATANANVGDLVVAEKYYKRAIDSAPTDYYRSLSVRSYAAFLFPQRRFEEGRDQFRRAVTLLKGGDNQVRLTNGVTYQMWGYSEKQSGAPPQAVDDLFQKAQNEFSGIDNQFLRDSSLQALEAARRGSTAVSVVPDKSSSVRE